MFNERKAAEMAAFLLQRAGGKLNVLKLTKLLYLAERESMAARGLSICGDRMVSMPQGPVLSQTLNLTNGNVVSADWEAFIEDREHHDVRLRNAVQRSDLNDLSDSAISILDLVWDKFGWMDQWQLVDFTHDKCAEWEDPNGSSLPIPPKRLFTAVGKSPEAADFMAKELAAQSHFDSLFSDDLPIDLACH
jgi:uncharacterized phage-associated protein